MGRLKMVAEDMRFRFAVLLALHGVVLMAVTQWI